MLKAIVLILAFTSTLSFGQSFQDSIKGNFVYFFDDQIIYNDHVLYVQPMYKQAYIEVGNTQFPTGMVKFYKNAEGFFANTIRNDFPNFALCKEMGKINFFKLSHAYYNVDRKHFPIGGLFGEGSKEFINKGFDNLEQADIKVLELYLGDNPKSMKHLKKYKTVRTVAISMVVTGGAAVVGGMVLFANTGDGSYAGTGFIVGIPLLLSQYVVILALPKKIKAVRYYNEALGTE